VAVGQASAAVWAGDVTAAPERVAAAVLPGDAVTLANNDMAATADRGTVGGRRYRCAMLARMSVTSMLDREVYVYAEVDKLIGLPSGTAKRWINGYERDGKPYPPILRVAPKETAWVTWGEFVEARMLAEYRDRKKVPIARQRAAIEQLRVMFKLDYPLAHLRPFLSAHARDLTMKGEEVGLPDIEITIRTGQALLGDARWLAETATLSQDDLGEPVIVELPADKDFPEIVINPSRYSGQPTFVGRRVSPVTIAQMVDSGEQREDLAADYGLSMRQVQDAIDYTKKYKLAKLTAA
jgi:uncharacterized protein (DUF433 family)